MIDYRALVAEAVQATRIVPPVSHTWFGRRSPGLRRELRGQLAKDDERSLLRTELLNRLYGSFYCSGQAVSTLRARRSSPLEAAALLARLAAVNRGTGATVTGWIVSSVRDSSYVVRREVLELWLPVAAQHGSGDEPLVSGNEIALRYPKELVRLSPGYYVALGELQHENDAPHLRIYFNVEPEGAVQLVRIATAELGKAGVPFSLKALADPQAYNRCDAAVLYLRRSDYGQVVAMLEGARARLSRWLKPGVPALTKRLASGIGLAEDPGGGESFGLHRCGLLADGIVSAYERGARRLESRLRVVEERFESVGLALAQPFLGIGSEDAFAELGPLSKRRTAFPSLREDRDGALAGAAVAIARKLCRDASWADDRCTWIGPRIQLHGEARDLAFASIGTEVYAGTAGVAEFLATVARQVDDRGVRAAAIGAIRHALAHARALKPERAAGLYTGVLGVALSATRVGTMLRESGIVIEADRLASWAVERLASVLELDLLSGKAGGIVALVALARELRREDLLEQAEFLGAQLLRAAEPSYGGCSWPSRARVARNLTGLSHGAAGMAFALLRLFEATGEKKYLQCARGAFRYERRWFDDAVGNWADLRRDPDGGYQRGRVGSRFSAAWCHGAPGIAVSRVDAYNVLGDEEVRRECAIALKTTERTLRATTAEGRVDFSVCHGIAGLAGVLLYGASILGAELDGAAELARRTANAGVHSYGGDVSWPCGTGGLGEHPGKMMGLAGIGAFLLSVHKGTRSPVLPG